MSEMNATTWRKSSHSSGGGGNCVEVMTVHVDESEER